jgi:hypothetical protein
LLTQDPLGLAGGVNLYEYAGSNPVSFDDPFGLCPACAAAGAAIGIAYTLWDNQRNGREWSDNLVRNTAIGSVAGFTLGAAATPAAGAQIATAGAAAAPAIAQGFQSFSSFKRAMGPAGDGQHWHHIVEQTPGNVSRFGAQAIHTGQNLVRVAAGVHQKISAYYSSKQAFTDGQTVRQWLSGQSLEQQRAFGQQVMEKFGVE